MIEYNTGDATRPTNTRSVIMHCCNDIGAWGSGFVLALNDTFDIGPRETYYNAIENGEGGGSVSFWRDPNSTLIVANIIGQHRTIRDETERPPIRYNWLSQGVRTVCKVAAQEEYEIACPRLGSGLAGGDWAVISNMIDAISNFYGVKVTVYDLPVDNSRPELYPVVGS